VVAEDEIRAGRTVVFDSRPLTIDDIVDISRCQAVVELSSDPTFRAFIQRGAAFVDQVLREDGVIYGVTTGFGDSCTVAVPTDLVAELPRGLYTFHGVGLGAFLSAEQTRATMAARLASLCRGFSGVSVELLDHLAALLQHDILPLIPGEGSVGASGDLTPLSYLAAVMCGEREVMVGGQRTSAARALAAAGLRPIALRPKECLALMNGTAVMTGLACLAWRRADYLAQLATRITALASIALDGNAHHFDETLFSVKPHAGQQLVAARIRSDLASGRPARNERRLQDRYSIRCTPHVIGVLHDALTWMKPWLETELNSANDNPIIDAEGEQVLHGGHFYGGHVAFTMDSLKQAVANVADLLDRQLALLVDPRFSNGLPANLSGATGARATINHGLKALQIGASAWTAEALKQTMPASVFSRSTECHNQDKVSMGTIAARDCHRVLDLSEQVVAALLIAVHQGVWLRHRQGQVQLTEALAAQVAMLRTVVRPLEEDRALDGELRELLRCIHDESWILYG
jgi:histidine ammonia-lyase